MEKNCQPADDSWTVEEVVEEEEEGRFALIRVSQNADYQPEQRWPERGQQLVVVQEAVQVDPPTKGTK